MKRNRLLLEIAALLSAIAFLAFSAWTRLPAKNLEMVFLDVGQGDAILIRTPDNRKILIDAGPPGAILPPLSAELNYFERKIDLAILTHPDADHIAGFPEILQRFRVGEILFTGVQPETEWYREILRQIAEQKIPTAIAAAESGFRFGDDVLLDVFWPEKPLAGQKAEDANAASVSLRLVFGETAAVLTGDLDTASEKKVLESGQELGAQVLKLGHHGSKTSNSPEFLAAVNPDIVIVSAGADNKFGHPHPEVLERMQGKQILETAKEGSIHLVSDGVQWRLEE